MVADPDVGNRLQASAAVNRMQRDHAAFVLLGLRRDAEIRKQNGPRYFAPLCFCDSKKRSRNHSEQIVVIR